MLVEHVTKIGAYFIFFSFIPCLSFMFYVIVCVFFLSHCVLFFCLVAYTLVKDTCSAASIITRFSVNIVRNIFLKLSLPYFSFSRDFHSRDFHPCTLVPRFPLPHFPLPRFQRPLCTLLLVASIKTCLGPLFSGAISTTCEPIAMKFDLHKLSYDQAVSTLCLKSAPYIVTIISSNLNRFS